MTPTQAKWVTGTCLVAFLGITAVAVRDHGIVGIFQYQLASTAGIQVLLDLTIALGLFIAWMWQDSKKNNRNPWIWSIAVIATGSIAALIYLSTRNRQIFSLLGKPSGRNRKPRLF